LANGEEMYVFLIIEDRVLLLIKFALKIAIEQALV
jgi:hypothetical protein